MEKFNILTIYYKLELGVKQVAATTCIKLNRNLFRQSPTKNGVLQCILKIQK